MVRKITQALATALLAAVCLFGSTYTPIGNADTPVQTQGGDPGTSGGGGGG